MQLNCKPYFTSYSWVYTNCQSKKPVKSHKIHPDCHPSQIISMTFDKHSSLNFALIQPAEVADFEAAPEFLVGRVEGIALVPWFIVA